MRAAAARAFARGRRANLVRTWVRGFAPGAIWGKPCQYYFLSYQLKDAPCAMDKRSLTATATADTRRLLDALLGNFPRGEWSAILTRDVRPHRAPSPHRSGCQSALNTDLVSAFKIESPYERNACETSFSLTKSLSVNNVFAGFAAAAPQGDGGGGEVMQGEGIRGCLFIADLELAEEIEPAV